MAPTDLLQGSLDPLTLGTLAIELQHGWRVSQRIRKVSGEILQVQQAGLCPASQRLGRRGWICSRRGVSDNNWRAKSYELTRFWRNQVEEEPKSWCMSRIGVDNILEMA